MDLASKIDNLFILTYQCPTDKEGKNDISKVEPKVSHADVNEGYVHDFEEIIETMQLSCCSLALSKREGAMWAVVESLLSGVPVVTTPSNGGRERYMNNDNSIVVDPKPERVREGVEKMCKANIDPKKVRSSCLRKIRKDRENTSEYISSKILENKMSKKEVYKEVFEKPGVWGRKI